MLETYLLEELVVFNQVGTLAETAKYLHLTQPTITRGLQKLEAEFGVPLFNRQPNRLTLTTTGKLAAQQAAHVLESNQLLLESVRNFDQRQQLVQIGSTLPGPYILIKRLQPQFKTQVGITNELIAPSNVMARLKQGNESVIFTNQEIQAVEINSQYVGTESLFAYLNKFMYVANQSTLTFKELAGMSFIVLQDIGPWRSLIQHEIPDAHFMYQADHNAMQQLTTYADFPAFTTNITHVEDSNTDQSDRIAIPIRDTKAKMPIYATYLRRSKQQIVPILDLIIEAWPK